MKIKDSFEPFFLWQEKMGMTPKTIKNDRYYLRTIANSIQDIEVMDLKKTDISKVIAAASKYRQVRTATGRRHDAEAPPVSARSPASRSRSAGRM